MAKMGQTRKKLLVSQAIQGRVLRHVAVYWLIYHFFLWHTLFVVDGLRGGDSLPFMDRYANFFQEHFLIVACGVAILPIVIWDMLKLTHRIAGPFVRFECALKEMAKGKQISGIDLRKKDLVTEFLAVFNEFIEYHNQAIACKASNSQPSGVTLTDDGAYPDEFADTTGDFSGRHGVDAV
jgi:hypothetical protein